jgi:DNA-binding CsgD family transcriptional regulator
LSPAVLKKFGLTFREAEVAALAAQGFSMINIATRLNISKNTVHTHMKRIYRKLDVFSRAELSHKLLR